MISFTSLFLGLVLGAQTIQVAVADGVDRVDLHLDGQIIGSLDTEPWSLEHDFGSELAPESLEGWISSREQPLPSSCPRRF
jgi:hypothetical protein